jgi:hypothetical protein
MAVSLHRAQMHSRKRTQRVGCVKARVHCMYVLVVQEPTPEYLSFIDELRNFNQKYDVQVNRFVASEALRAEPRP